jgi:hypothetical protein
MSITPPRPTFPSKILWITSWSSSFIKTSRPPEGGFIKKEATEALDIPPPPPAYYQSIQLHPPPPVTSCYGI